MAEGGALPAARGMVMAFGSWHNRFTDRRDRNLAARTGLSFPMSASLARAVVGSNVAGRPASQGPGR